MTIKNSLYFTYNGISSEDFGIMNVSVSNGLYEEPFLASREVKSFQIKGRTREYFQRVVDKPIDFSLQFAFEDTWDNDKIRAVARWLSQSDSDFPQPKPLTFSGDPDRIYYAVYSGDTKLIHNGCKQGYVEITMHTDSPYAYSEKVLSPSVDLSANTQDGTLYYMDNNGDLPLYPEIWITKVGVDNGDIKIVNESNGGQTFQFKTAARARGVLSFVGSVADGQTVTIGQDIYEFDTNGSVATGNILVDVSTDQSAANASSVLAGIINTTTKHENVTATNNTANNSITVTYGLVGTVGNIATTTTCTNASWGNTTLVGIDGLLDGEQVYINCEEQDIVSSLESENIYRYDTFNNSYLILPSFSRSRLRIYGNCIVQFRSEFKLLQG